MSPRRRVGRRAGLPESLLLAGALAVLGLPAPLPAQDATPARLTLAEAARRALASHPDTRAAAARLDASRAAAGEVRAARLPSVTLTGSAIAYSDPMLVSPLHGLTPETAPAFDETLIQGAAGARYTLFDGGIRGARIRQADAEAEASAAAGQRVEDGLLARVAAAYFDALARSRVLDAHRRRVEAVAAEERRARQMHAAGRAAVLDVHRAAAALAEARAEETRQRVALDVARRELARLVGDSAEAVIPASAVRLRDGTPPPRPAALAAAVATSPDVEEARRRAAAARAGRAVARGGRWPTVSLVGNWIGRAGAESELADEWNGGVQVSWPVFTGGATARRVAQADASGRAAEEEVRRAELDAADRADQALAELAETEARLASLAEAEAAYAAVAAAERLRLDTGVGTQTDYLAAEANLLGARAELARTEYRRLAARVELARLTGRLNLDWLVTELEQLP